MMFLPLPAVSPRMTLHDSPAGVPGDAVCAFLGALPDWQAASIRAAAESMRIFFHVGYPCLRWEIIAIVP
ncbi:hypothetical protein BWZ27_10900 [Neisseria meningitidis]|nr:hypothetical protein BWZ27_10900 [Neisseria meningitidis]OMH42255.1 hypothetical protein BWZ30_10630 [Neisseria meningitidis]OMH47951.1 hypothetical protein BWZ31_10815 [Neisseria meningitidis]